MAAGSFAIGIGLRELLRRRTGTIGRGQEDDFAVCCLRHGLHGFEVSDLHGWS